MASFNFEFKSKAYDDDTFKVLIFNGTESVSSLYQYSIKVVSQRSDIVMDKMGRSSVQLIISSEASAQPKYINGMVKSVSLIQVRSDDLYVYQVVMVPRFWAKTRNTNTRGFYNKSTSDIIFDELECSKFNNEISTISNSPFEYECLFNATYDKKEFTLQYKESDHAFVTRLMEYDGLYYFFEHDQYKEKMIVSDSNIDSYSILGDKSEVMVSFDNASTDDLCIDDIYPAENYGSRDMQALEEENKKIVNAMLSQSLQDDINSKNDCKHLAITNNNQSDNEQKRIQQVRKELIECRNNIYEGSGNHIHFSAGTHFHLKNSIEGKFDKPYFLVSVSAFGSQDIDSWEKVSNADYHNNFECIPFELNYRHRIETSIPKISGVIAGVVMASEHDQEMANIDENGRYQIEMYYDIDGLKYETVTHFLFVSQSLDSGLLKPGTKLLISFIDADVNHPIVLSKLPDM